MYLHISPNYHCFYRLKNGAFADFNNSHLTASKSCIHFFKELKTNCI